MECQWQSKKLLKKKGVTSEDAGKEGIHRIEIDNS